MASILSIVKDVINRLYANSIFDSKILKQTENCEKCRSDKNFEKRDVFYKRTATESTIFSGFTAAFRSDPLVKF